tara:strand:- start:162 stop:578 length:417 start_codon:yes stop_codon:yes gene_type:complete
MKEGWHENTYLILFEAEEIRQRGLDYKIEQHLPGHSLLGMCSWDNFIVREDASGKLFLVPTLPIKPENLVPWLDKLPDSESLEHDDEVFKKVKWYLDPVIFGGNPEPGDNMVWITHKDHVDAVNYWNHIYDNTVKLAK